MNLGKIFSLLNDSNVDKAEVFKLVDRIKGMNLEDEENLRDIIKQASIVANKPLSKEVEDNLVKKIQKEGFTTSLLDYL